MNIQSMTDGAICEVLGRRLQALRLKSNLAQDEIAREAGISRQTLFQLLKHGKGTVATLIAVLRAIGELERLSSLIEDVRPSPLAIIKMAGKVRSRASGSRRKEASALVQEKPDAEIDSKEIDW